MDTTDALKVKYYSVNDLSVQKMRIRNFNMSN